eukprot:1365592-Amorphochlora_amoeboformis.AAC.1
MENLPKSILMENQAQNPEGIPNRDENQHFFPGDEKQPRSLSLDKLCRSTPTFPPPCSLSLSLYLLGRGQMPH